MRPKKILATLLTVMMVLVIVPTGVLAKEYTDGYYTYTVTNGKATITDVDSSIDDDVTIPNTLDGYPVTSIGDYAFDGCTNLPRVTIPDNVVNIDHDAFISNCPAITIYCEEGSPAHEYAVKYHISYVIEDLSAITTKTNVIADNTSTIIDILIR